MLGWEVPLAAVLWQHLLAHTHGLRLLPLLDAGLALSCWLIFLTHRTLDTFSAQQAGAAPKTQPVFFRKHRRLLLLAVMPAIAAWLAWAALWVIPEGILWQAAGVTMLVAMHLASSEMQGSTVSRDVFLCGAALGGILLISRMPLPVEYRLMLSLILLGAIALSFLRQIGLRLLHWPSRDSTAALIFALGCTTSTRFLGMSEHLLEPTLECLLLMMVFACHCRAASGRTHVLLAAATLSLSATLLVLISSGTLDSSLRSTVFAALGVVCLQALLRLSMTQATAETQRALAGLALMLSPLIIRLWFA